MRTVPLTGPAAGGRVAYVDDEDYPLVSRYSWNFHVSNRGWQNEYARSTIVLDDGTRKGIFMHQLIFPRGRIDHEDGNGLNNQKYNLRKASQSQNGGNQRKAAGKSSQYKGVSWNQRERRWYAKIRVDGAQQYLGRFTDEAEAARAYDRAALEAWGRFARPNFPQQDAA